MTAGTTADKAIAPGATVTAITGTVERMGHHPMGLRRQGLIRTGYRNITITAPVELRTIARASG